jgi:hypothetical protein
MICSDISFGDLTARKVHVRRSGGLSFGWIGCRLGSTWRISNVTFKRHHRQCAGHLGRHYRVTLTFVSFKSCLSLVVGRGNTNRPHDALYLAPLGCSASTNRKPHTMVHRVWCSGNIVDSQLFQQLTALSTAPGSTPGIRVTLFHFFFLPISFPCLPSLSNFMFQELL